jgi:hypothetical protein
MHPMKLAEAREEIGYKSAASEAQAKAQMAWRKRIKRDPNTFPSEAFRHPFIDRDGRERREFFSGRGLAIMQEYRIAPER